MYTANSVIFSQKEILIVVQSFHSLSSLKQCRCRNDLYLQRIQAQFFRDRLLTQKMSGVGEKIGRAILLVFNDVIAYIKSLIRYLIEARRSIPLAEEVLIWGPLRRKYQEAQWHPHESNQIIIAHSTMSAYLFATNSIALVLVSSFWTKFHCRCK